MRKSLGLALMVVLFAVPAAAQKVYVDYDRNAIKNDYRTFAWQETGPTLQEFAPLMHTRIKNGIEHYLTTRGFIEDLDNPDLYVTYHTSSHEELQFSVTGYGYGYGAGWGWDPYWGGPSASGGGANTTISTYEKGTLVIDIWDAKTNEIVWRGTASAVVSENPKKAQKTVEKALEKMVKQFRELKAEEAKKGQ